LKSENGSREENVEIIEKNFEIDLNKNKKIKKEGGRKSKYFTNEKKRERILAPPIPMER